MSMSEMPEWALQAPMDVAVEPGTGRVFVANGGSGRVIVFERDGTFVVPGSAFGMDEWLRIGYACASAVLEGGLAGVSACLRELEAKRPSA